MKRIIPGKHNIGGIYGGLNGIYVYNTLSTIDFNELSINNIFYVIETDQFYMYDGNNQYHPINIPSILSKEFTIDAGVILPLSQHYVIERISINIIESYNPEAYFEIGTSDYPAYFWSSINEPLIDNDNVELLINKKFPSIDNLTLSIYNATQGKLLLTVITGKINI